MIDILIFIVVLITYGMGWLSGFYSGMVAQAKRQQISEKVKVEDLYPPKK